MQPFIVRYFQVFGHAHVCYFNAAKDWCKGCRPADGSGHASWEGNSQSQLGMRLTDESQEERDLVTGLRSRMNAGRPNWNKVFTKLQEEKKGKVTVFYCGNPMLAKTLRKKCAEFGFGFRKEVF